MMARSYECALWMEDLETSGRGECRRHLLVREGMGQFGGIRGVWPPTFEVDGCREFEDKRVA